MIEIELVWRINNCIRIETSTKNITLGGYPADEALLNRKNDLLA